ncbi:MAG: tRNA (adenosine(37)-N6)-dimethylallyltransferase MiaA [Holosporaceae bacterium]|nr:tRNA (adenosine(37)-N6)-dimethylallyltransferase MiaA [Holosporaceae bacterium]
MASNLIVIVGPTASGKSELAIKLAQHLRNTSNVDAEIINADSIQLYDELKILTAYPCCDSLAKVKHHLYGVLSPHETSSVSFWVDLAAAKIRQLHQQGKVAIICGGTGLYVEALLGGISNIPQIPADFRAEVQKKFEQMGRDAFFDLLQNLDPDLCKTLHKNNTQRILRAYEVVSYTKKPLSSWWKENDREREAEYREVSQIVLMPPREQLNARCLLRIEKMISNGAIDEVEQFVKKYPGYDGSMNNVIGYKEILSLLNKKISISECMELMLIRTKQYAKRQSTWFRHRMKNSKIITEFGSDVVLCS